MAIENEKPDFIPNIEGYNMESNIFRAGRNFVSEPLSGYEIHTFTLKRPELRFPSVEAMLNVQHDLIMSHPTPNLTLPDDSDPQETFQLVINKITPKSSPQIFAQKIDPLDFLNHPESTPDITPTYTPPPVIAPLTFKPYTPPKFDLPDYLNQSDEKKEENESQSALEEVVEGLASIFNPLSWFG
jgi:hypothetical protein